jgi:hypothetical protein
MTDDRNTSAAHQAFKSLFRRLARLAIEAGLTAPMAHRLLKEAMVETAEADYTLDGKRLTDSRISVLTGVHRKDIRTFRSETPASTETASQKVSVLSTVVGRWLGTAELNDASGKPIPLPRAAESGPSFDGLVESVTSDVRPRTLLDELVRSGAAAVDKTTDTVTLTQHALISAASLEDGLYFLDRNVGDHIAAVAQNVVAGADTAPLLERAVFYNNLHPDDVDRLQAISREKGVALLEEINREALDLQTRREQSGDGDERFRLGVYFYREQTNTETDR